MEILIARPCGFCFGGKRSVDIANNVGKAYSLGPILHNEQLIEKLREKGVEPCTFEELMKKKPGKVIIRAHGVPAVQIDELKKKGFDVIDATCSNVVKVYDIAMKCEKEGYQVVVYGEKEHAEVVGLVSRLKNPIVVENADEVPRKLSDKVCLVSQTTKIPEKYDEIRKNVKEKCKDLKAFDTICSATQERQKAAVSLAKNVDVMLVIGGKKSSNTHKLFEVCKAVNEKTYHIQTQNNINKLWFTDSKRVGITAGASTPDFVINSVVEAVETWTKANFTGSLQESKGKK